MSTGIETILIGAFRPFKCWLATSIIFYVLNANGRKANKIVPSLFLYNMLAYTISVNYAEPQNFSRKIHPTLKFKNQLHIGSIKVVQLYKQTYKEDKNKCQKWF